MIITPIVNYGIILYCLCCNSCALFQPDKIRTGNLAPTTLILCVSNQLIKKPTPAIT